MSVQISAKRVIVPVLAVAVAYTGFRLYTERRQLGEIELPDGFRITVFAQAENARQMALGDGGTVFVGSRSAGVVNAAVDGDGDGRADVVHRIASGLTMPSGIAFRDGALYVAARNLLLRYDGIESRLTDPPEPVIVRDDLPRENHHGWKYLGFGPDGRLYVPVGAPCNVCLQTDERFASILRMQPDGSDLEVYAHGVRNSVGFDWDPRTGDLWFTDNGRDMLGDDRPDDELNHAPEPGLHFGFPFCHAGTIPDPEFGERRACSEFTPPAARLGAHVASIGMTFYTGTMFPEEYRNNIFIAEHGSWNRSSKVGYRVVRVVVENGRVVREEPFAEGWLQGERNWGRPTDVMVMPDGALLVADDQQGAIYRITYAP